MLTGIDASPIAMVDFLLTLAQGRTSPTPQQQREILFWSVVLVVAGVVIGFAGYLIYRRLKKANEPSPESAGFSLSEVRRLYEAGEVSHEEFMQVKQRILEAARRSIDGTMTQVQAVRAPEGQRPRPRAEAESDDSTAPASGAPAERGAREDDGQPPPLTDEERDDESGDQMKPP